MKRPVDQLKTFFETGDTPTQQQFWDWLESYVHKDDGIAMENVAGLVAVLNGKASQALLEQVRAAQLPYKLVLNVNGSYQIPAGYSVRYLIISPTVDSTITVDVDGDLFMPETFIAAGFERPILGGIVARTERALNFSGIAGPTTILIYTETLTPINP